MKLIGRSHLVAREEAGSMEERMPTWLCWAGLLGLCPGLREWRRKRAYAWAIVERKSYYSDGPRTWESTRLRGWGRTGQRSGERLRVSFPFSIFFYLVFKTNFKCKPNQIQIEFWIYFSTQIKMSHFGKFFENKLYNFLNPFIFKFSFLSFLLLQSHF